MANSKLRGVKVKLPDKLMEYLKNIFITYKNYKDYKGYDRLVNLLNTGVCTYENLKRIKNYFDSLNDDNYNEVEYELNGGEIMSNWVNKALDFLRSKITNQKVAKSNAELDNAFRKEDDDILPDDGSYKNNLKSYPDIMGNLSLLEVIKYNKK